MAELTPLDGDETRQAVDAMRGYDYQVWQTLNAWLSLEDGEVLFLEGAEDFDVINPEGAVAVQVKARSSRISLGRQEARKAIINFLELKRRNPSLEKFKYIYLTTAEVGPEQSRPFGRQMGIHFWGDCQRTGLGAEEICRFFLSFEDLDPSIRIFMERRHPREVLDELIRRLTWLPYASSRPEIEKQVLDKLVEVGWPKGISIKESEGVLDRLFFEIHKVVIQDKNRHLNRADFLRIFEEASIGVSKRDSSSPALLGTSVQHLKRLIVAKWGKDYTPSDLLGRRAFHRKGYREIYYFRPELDTKLATKIAEGKNVLLFGPPLAGKSRAVLEYINKHRSETPVILLKAAELHGNYRAALEELPKDGRSEQSCLYILDDIVDFTEDASGLRFLLDEILEISEKNQMIAMSRRAKLPMVQEALQSELCSEFCLLEIPPISSELRNQLKQAGHVDPEMLLPSSAIGSYFFENKIIREVYTELLGKTDQRPQRLQVEALRTSRCLDIWRRRTQGTKGSICDYLNKRLKAHYHDGKPVSDSEWRDTCLELQNKGFAIYNEDSLDVETAYLEYIVGRSTSDGRGLEESDKDLALEGLRFYPEAGTYARVIGRFPEADIDWFWHLIDRMMKEDIEIDNWVMSALVSRVDSVAEALQVCAGLEEKSLRPDGYSYNLALTKSQNIDQVKQVHKKMQAVGVETNAVTFYSILGVLNNHEDKAEILEWMIAEGVEIESRAFLALLDRSQGFEKALNALQMCLQAVTSPGKKFLKKFIGSVADRASSVEECWQLWRCLQDSGHHFSGFAAARMLHQAKNREQALDLYRKLKDGGIKPAPVVHTALLSKYQDVGSSLRFLVELRSDRCEISINNCNEILKQVRNGKEASELVQFMLETKIRPDNMTFSELGKLFRAGRVSSHSTQVLDLLSCLGSGPKPNRLRREGARFVRSVVHWQIKRLRRRAGTIEELWLIFFRLRVMAIQPSKETLSIFLSRADSNAATLAQSLQSLGEISEEPFENLARELAVEQRENLLEIELQFLEDIWERMGEAGRGFVRDGYHVIFEQTCSRWKEARRAFDHLEDLGLLNEPLLASAIANSQNLGKALKVVKASKRRGLNFSVSGEVVQMLEALAKTPWDHQQLDLLLHSEG